MMFGAAARSAACAALPEYNPHASRHNVNALRQRPGCSLMEYIRCLGMKVSNTGVRKRTPAALAALSSIEMRGPAGKVRPVVQGHGAPPRIASC